MGLQAWRVWRERREERATRMVAKGSSPPPPRYCQAAAQPRRLALAPGRVTIVVAAAGPPASRW